MVRGKEDILHFFKAQNAPYWTIYQYSGDKANFICKMEDTPNLSPEIAQEKLESYLNWLAPGRYRLVCKRSYSDNKGFSEMGIELIETPSTSKSFTGPNQMIASAPGAPVAVSGPDGIQQVYVPQSSVQGEIQKALADYEAKREQKELQKKLSELEKENRELKREQSNDVIGRIFGHIEPHIPMFIEGIKKQSNSSSISGHQMNTSTQQKESADKTDQDATQKLTELIQKWENQFPGDPIAVIEKVVSIMEESPSKYSMYRNMLLS